MRSTFTAATLVAMTMAAGSDDLIEQKLRSLQFGDFGATTTTEAATGFGFDQAEEA